MEAIDAGAGDEHVQSTIAAPEPLPGGVLEPTTDADGSVRDESEKLESEWVTLKSIQYPSETSQDNKLPNVDIVHVTAMCAEDDMCDPDVLLKDLREMERRELVFRSDMSALLVGDLTQASVERQATCLLRGIAAKQSDVPNERRAIIFVAYDLGSLVVKTALYLAARSEDTYPGISSNTAHVIFSGCLQRGADAQEVTSKLLDFLHDRKSEAWSHLITGRCIDNLARSVLRTTEMFISSKVTLRSRIISLYANEKQLGKIYPSFDCYTATLGIPAEITIKEEVGDDSAATTFPDLSSYASFLPMHWLPHPDWVPLERAFLSLSAPHRQSRLDPRQSPTLEPFLDAREYTNWNDSVGSQILYVHGPSYHSTHDVADQVFLAWQVKRQANGEHAAARSLSFTFDSTDPLRDSLPDMLAHIVMQAMAEQAIGSTDERYHILHDLFLMRAGWTIKSCLSTLETIRLRVFAGDTGTVLLLHDFDECSQESRAAFLDYYTELSVRSESQFKLVITSRRPNALLPELGDQWAKLNVDAVVPFANGDINGTSHHLTRLCLLEGDKNHILTRIKDLAPMDAVSLHTTLELLQTHTGWPRDPSAQSLAQFIRLLDLIAPSDTTKEVLDKILRSNTDSEGVRWVLSWLLCGYRPLSLPEFATILHQGRRGHHTDEPGTPSLASPVQDSMGPAQNQLECWLRVFADFSHDKVTIRHEIWDLLGDDMDTENFIWNEAQRSAHESIVEFCLAYLTRPMTLETLASTFRQYESRVHGPQQAQQVTAPIVPDGQEIAFYMVPALPHHLSKCPPTYVASIVRSLLADSATQSSALWAKVYWAMSNPLSRTQGAPDSVLPVLAELGLLSPEEIRKTDASSQAQCLVAAAGSNQGDVVSSVFQQETFDLSLHEDVLLAAIQAGDETTALRAAHAILSHPEWDQNAHLWPWSAIWAATWLNMAELVETLLSNGASPDPQAAQGSSTNLPLGFHVSPLYVASILGHSAMVRILLSHGASRDVRRANLYSPFYAAACNGHVETVLEYVVKDRSYLEASEPITGVYVAAMWGNRKVVEALVELGADVNKPQDCPDDEDHNWTPLAAACCWAYPDTTEVLLAHGADANCPNPYGMDTPLWYAAAFNPSLACVGALLRHGGDPNHERFRPPLIYEIASSSEDSGILIEVCDVLIAGEPPINVNALDVDGATALMVASKAGKLALVRWLLDHGADVDALDVSKRSALYFAVAASQTAVVEELLKRQPKMDVLDESRNETLLHTALSRPAILKLLLDAGADPNLTSLSGHTPIHLAAYMGNAVAVKLLVEKKADPNREDKYGETAIVTAVTYARDASLTRLLADAGAKLDIVINGSSLLHHALDGPAEVLKILLEFRKAVNINIVDDYKRTPLLVAATLQNVEHLRLLIRAGADVNAQDKDGDTALREAVRTDRFESLSLLLAEPDIDVNRMAPGWGGPLHMACFHVDVASVRTLLDHGADVHVAMPNAFQGSPLMAALLPVSEVTRDQDAVAMDEIVRMLVFKGASVQQTVRGSRFYTALSAGCFAGGIGTLNFLLDEGASVQLADPVSGRLPLHFAAANGLDNFKAILLSYRGNMMAADKEDKNCLHWAAQFGNARTVEFILSKLSESQGPPASYVNVPDSDGWTPLCWAVRRWDDGWCEGMRSERRDFIAVVRILLWHGADPTVQCRLGNGATTENGTETETDTKIDTDTITPLDLARRCDANQDIIDMVKSGLRERRESEGSQATEETEGPVRRYIIHDDVCDICLNRIFGLVYRCTSCANYDICTKCLPHKMTFHNRDTQGDGQEHTFELRSDRDEYIKPSPPLEADKDENEDIANVISVSDEGSEEDDRTCFNSDNLDDIEFDNT